MQCATQAGRQELLINQAAYPETPSSTCTRVICQHGDSPHIHITGTRLLIADQEAFTNFTILELSPIRIVARCQFSNSCNALLPGHSLPTVYTALGTTSMSSTSPSIPGQWPDHSSFRIEKKKRNRIPVSCGPCRNRKYAYPFTRKFMVHGVER